jgi:hypothetical protein
MIKMIKCVEDDFTFHKSGDEEANSKKITRGNGKRSQIKNKEPHDEKRSKNN